MLAATIGALLAACAGDIGGAFNPEGEGDVGHVVGQALGTTLPIVAGTTAQLIMMQALIKKLKTSLITPISKMEMDDTGIKIHAMPTNSAGMQNSGVQMSIGPTAAAPTSSIKIIPGASESITLEKALNGGKITVDDTGVSISKEPQPACSIKVTNDSVKIEKAAGGQILVRNTGVSFSKIPNGAAFTAQANVASMMVGNNSITVSNQGIDLSFRQGQGVQMGSLSVDPAGFIKLG